MTSSWRIALSVAILAFAMGSNAFRLPGRALRDAAADAPATADLTASSAPSSLDDLTDAQIDFMLENNMTLDDAQLMQAAGPMQTKGFFDWISNVVGTAVDGVKCAVSWGLSGTCDEAVEGVVEVGSGTGHALLKYTEYPDTFFSASSSCSNDYSWLPDDNRSEESSMDDCKVRCEEKIWCTDFTYYPSKNSCTLFNINDDATAATWECSSSKGAISGSYTAS